jgi:hypothetical protein
MTNMMDAFPEDDMRDALDHRNRYANDLDGFSAYTQDLAQELFEQNGGGVGVAVIIDAMNGKPPLTTLVKCDPENLTEALAFMQNSFEELRVERAAHIGEFWASKYPKEKGIPADAPRPSLDPNRLEMVRVVVRDCTGAGLMSFAEIIRPADGPPQLGPWETQPAETGPLLGVVPTQ